MIPYVARRLLMVIPTLVGVMLIVFFLTFTIGNPAVLLVPAEAEPADIARVEAALGLDQPIPVQFAKYLGRIVRLDFGTSFYSDGPAMQLVLSRLPATLQLSLAAAIIAVMIGVPAGLFGALWRGRAADMFLSASVLFGMSIPNFWLGLVLIIFFGVQLKLLPISGMGTIKHLVLPSITLATGMLASIARLIRNDLLDVLGADFIRTAQAKGVGRAAVFVRHALKNSLSPVITLSWPTVGCAARRSHRHRKCVRLARGRSVHPPVHRTPRLPGGASRHLRPGRDFHPNQPGYRRHLRPPGSQDRL